MEALLQQYGLEVSLFFLVGLLAEIHCLGMCGPLITAYARPNEAEDRSRISWNDLGRHFSYHGFRILTYGLFGALFGLLGATLVPAESIGGTLKIVRGIVGVLVGGVIALYGLSYLFRGRSSTVLERSLGRLGGRAFSLVGRVIGREQPDATNPSSARGSLHALLPCPILYPAYLYVLARGSPAFGFVAMTLLGAGTVPLLLAYGLFLEGRSNQFPRVVHQFLGATLILLAYVSLSMGLRNLGIDVPAPGLPFYQPFQP